MFINDLQRRETKKLYFIEFQYCNRNFISDSNGKIKLNKDEHWRDDSLYLDIDDIDIFIFNYGDIFNWGLYTNEKSGLDDIYFVNYYSIEEVNKIMNIIDIKKPNSYSILLNWLNKAKEFKGIYIIGIG